MLPKADINVFSRFQQAPSNADRVQMYESLHRDLCGESSPTFNTDLRNPGGSYDSASANLVDQADEFRMVDNYGDAKESYGQEENVLTKKYHESSQNEAGLFKKVPTITRELTFQT